jgi:hypothetical protein
VNDILNNEVNLLIVVETNGYYHHFQIVTAKSVSYVTLYFVDIQYRSLEIPIVDEI